MKKMETNKYPHAYVARTKDKQLLKRCTSGGVFTAIAIAFVADGGYACGAVYDSDFSVRHIVTNNTEDVIRFAGSKYVESDLSDTYKKIKKLLSENQKVLFCGTPCQAEGLNCYLNNCMGQQSNLFTVDLVCHGVPSPLLWKKYLDYSQEKRGILKDVNFRSKYLGYHVSVMEEVNSQGKQYIGSARTHIMSKFYFRNIADRPSCYSCRFKTVERSSDLTIFDSWHAALLVEGIVDDDMGYTNVLVQSEKGDKLLRKYKADFDLHLCDIVKAIELDGSMAVKSVERHKRRDEFYQYLNKHGIEETVNFFMPISAKDLMIDGSKTYLKKLGILSFIKKGRSGK